MDTRQQLVEQDVDARRYEYDDSVVLAADLGHTGSASVDVVGDTVIVVTDSEQFEVEVEGAVEASARNGVLTVEVSA